MIRPTVAVFLPPDEAMPIVTELDAAGFDCAVVGDVDELGDVLASPSEVAVAIIDCENDFDASLLMYERLHRDDLAIPALMIVSTRALERLAGTPGAASINDEFVTRPYSAESIRWRVEAMLIRSQTVDDTSGSVLKTGPVETTGWGRRASVVVVFNPKGGVGKTTIATNLAAALQMRKGLRVLLIDADTVTGHVATSLGLEHWRTVSDSWREEAQDGVTEHFLDIASEHSSGMKVITLTSSPLHADVLDAERVGDAVSAARRSFDFIVVDTHPSYGPMNLALFDRADRILLPVTPDLPALRAAVQFRDVATELGIRERISMVVNRANSGVSVADMERSVGLPALALIRSAGLVFVKAANEGRTVIERSPKERVTEDFDGLADRLLPPARTVVPQPKAAMRGLFTRKEPVRA